MDRAQDHFPGVDTDTDFEWHRLANANEYLSGDVLTVVEI